MDLQQAVVTHRMEAFEVPQKYRACLRAGTIPGRQRTPLHRVVKRGRSAALLAAAGETTISSNFRTETWFDE
jgi:hypothetical protein